jgi:hypothetical protein
VQQFRNNELSGHEQAGHFTMVHDPRTKGRLSSGTNLTLHSQEYASFSSGLEVRLWNGVSRDQVQQGKLHNNEACGNS